MARKSKRTANKRLATGVVRGTQTRKGRQGNTRAARVGQAVKSAQAKSSGVTNSAKPKEAAPQSTFRNPFNLKERINEVRK